MIRPGSHAGLNAAERPAYGTVRLGDGRVVLRPWQLSDAPLMATACADPEIALFCMMPAGYTIALARDFIADAPRAWAEDGWLHLALTKPRGRRPLGAVGALQGDPRLPNADLGYWVMPEHRGRGLATAGVSLLTDWAFGTLGLRRLSIGTMVANEASRRIARELGFTPEALLRNDRPFGPTRTDCVVYSLLADEWRARRASGAEGRPQGPPPDEPRGMPPDETMGKPSDETMGKPSDEALLPALAAARTDYPAATPTLPAAPPLLGDGAIVLRPYTEADLPDLVRACNDPETQRWLFALPTPYTDIDARDFVARTTTGWRAANEAFFSIADAASDRFLGGIALHGGEVWAGVAEIGYQIAPWARRRGVATAAARLVAQWGLDVLGLARLQILADTRNVASCGVAGKLGFVAEGLRRRDHGRPGDLGDHAVFSLLQTDPRPW